MRGSSVSTSTCVTPQLLAEFGIEEVMTARCDRDQGKLSDPRGNSLVGAALDVEQRLVAGKKEAPRREHGADRCATTLLDATIGGSV